MSFTNTLSKILTPGFHIRLEDYKTLYAIQGSIRNAIDRARMRQANRLFNRMNGGTFTKLDLMTLEADDITASRVFSGQVEGLDPSEPITG